MRLGVIDVGSNTVHLLVVDAHRGAQPHPATSHKIELRLSEHVADDGHIQASGATALVEFVRECLLVAEDQGVEEVMAFATSAIREAPNGEDVLAQVRTETGVPLIVHTEGYRKTPAEDFPHVAAFSDFAALPGIVAAQAEALETAG